MHLTVPKLNKITGLLIKLAILLLSIGFLYKQLTGKEKVEDILSFISNLKDNSQFLLLLLGLLALMMINWGFEALKWRLLVAKIERITFLRAFLAVFAGLAIGIFTPNKTGEFAGRMLAIEKGSRIKSVLITFIGSLSQLLVTIIGGFAGSLFVLFVLDKQNTVVSSNFKFGILILCFFLFVIGVFFYLNINVLSFFARKLIIKKMSKLKRFFSIYEEYYLSDLLKILGLSFFRYIVFNIQLVLIILFFGIEMPIFHLLSLTFIWFFIITVIPTITLTEIGVRGAVSVFVFSFYFKNFASSIEPPNIELKVIAATFILWLINIVLPSLVGALSVFRFNIFPKKQSNG